MLLLVKEEEEDQEHVGRITTKSTDGLTGDRLLRSVEDRVNGGKLSMKRSILGSRTAKGSGTCTRARYVMNTHDGPFVVRPVVISRKVSKIEQQLLWNIIQNLSPQILLLHSNPPQTPLGRYYSLYIIIFIIVSNEICSNIYAACCSTRRQTTSAVVNTARPSSRNSCR